MILQRLGIALLTYPMHHRFRQKRALKAPFCLAEAVGFEPTVP